MKKVLLATTAITAISLAGIASAQESQMMSAGGNTLSIGGYYEFGYASASDDLDVNDGSDSKTYGESELFIDFSTTADSGLPMGFRSIWKSSMAASTVNPALPRMPRNPRSLSAVISAPSISVMMTMPMAVSRHGHRPMKGQPHRMTTFCSGPAVL